MINRLQRRLIMTILMLTFFSTFSASTYACVLKPHFPICAIKCVIFSSHTATCIIGSDSPNNSTPEQSTPVVFKNK
ncbi:hypothetical protein PTE_04031 [Photorhabdus khanii NC19]|uniref:Secreted protein n=1 Tax=Photorhabdus khanii NC19 TaxID=1004151 RepID=W3V3C1_9GAMM|nr:hypothetical protein PTE_04031 [Photorhabdus khanii NC19]